MRAETINNIFELFKQNNYQPTTELNYTNLFTLLVAVILSARATDASVNKATKNLFLQYDTPEKMLELGEEGLKTYIKTLGLYNSKAKNIMAVCEALITQYQSTIPNNLEQLVKLPGVGRKTANVVLNCGFGIPTMPVDTHVFRVVRRLGITYTANHKKIEEDLLESIPERFLPFAHHWLVLHGRYICKARKPLCGQCQLTQYCNYYNQDFRIFRD